MVRWLTYSPCKPGVICSMPGFSSLSDETKIEVPSPYDHSYLEVKKTHQDRDVLAMPTYSFKSYVYNLCNNRHDQNENKQ